MSILKVPSTQVLLSGRNVFGGKAGSARRGHENSGNIPVDLGTLAVTTAANHNANATTMPVGQAQVGAYQFSLATCAAAILSETVTLTAATNEFFAIGSVDGGIVVEHVSTLGTEAATMDGSNRLTNFPGYGSVAFNEAGNVMTYQRQKGVDAIESFSAVNVYIRLGTQTIDVEDP
jgi:hypothetical protein